MTPRAHALTHEGAARTIARLSVEFAEDPRVEFRYFANSAAAGLRPGGIELTANPTMRQIDSGAAETVPVVSTDIPKGLSFAEIQSMSQVDLGDYLERIAVTAVSQCRSNKNLFLKRYPRLDFRRR